MPNAAFAPAVLRELAMGFLADLAERETHVPPSDQADLATSLVRQWVTCGGNAVVIVDDRIMYLSVGQTPLGKPRVHAEVKPMHWDRILADWKIALDDVPDLIGRLNLAQSAEVTNADGLLLRLWVNPAERSRGVEELVKQPLPTPRPARDLVKFATNALRNELRVAVDADELRALADSVVAQWNRFRGRACVFLDASQQLVLIVKERADGCTDLTAQRRTSRLGAVFCELGVKPQSVPQAIARLNLEQKAEIEDESGAKCVLTHNPLAMRFDVRRGLDARA
jgi:hypothetical protein